MKPILRLLGLLLVLPSTISPAQVSSVNRAWFGSWKLDSPASRLKGQLIVIGKAPRGYRFDFGAVSFDIPEDGRFYPTVASRETSLRKLSPSKWLRVHRNRAIDLDRSLLTISADNRTMSIVTSTTSRSYTHETLNRVGRGSGLAQERLFVRLVTDF